MQRKTGTIRKDIMKNSKKTRFGVVDFALVDQGIPPLETVVYSYIKRFQRTKGPIWASIPYIAKDLRMSESSVQRYIKHLIKVGLFKQESKGLGRGRYLSTTPLKLIGDPSQPDKTPCQSDATPCQPDRGNPCQSDMLSKLSDRSYISEVKNRSDQSRQPQRKKQVVKVETKDDKNAYLEFKKSLLDKQVDYSDISD